MKTKPRTRKAALKRFKVTASGKVLHRAKGSRHRMSHKSAKQKRRLSKLKPVAPEFEKKIKQMLVIA